MEFRLKSVLFMGLLISLFACQEEEALQPARFISDRLGQVDMVSQAGSDYQQQLYFDLSSGELQANHRRDAWDLGLSADGLHPNIFVNSAMLMAVAPTGSSNFNQSFDPANFNFEHERVQRIYNRAWMQSDFDGDAKPQGEVFLIDLGLDMRNRARGYRKLQILNYEAGRYQLRLANLDGGDESLLDLQTDPVANNQYISFSNPDSLLNLEPPKEDWDLLFTRYMELLWDGQDSLDYSVTGVLLNPYAGRAYLDTNLTKMGISYLEVDRKDFLEEKLSHRSDAIGYNWKYFNLDESTYKIYPGWIYFIEDAQAQIYRLRFIGFYDNSGAKGAVSFEYLPL